METSEVGDFFLLKKKETAENKPLDRIIPYGVRTRVFALKKQCPRPLDERDFFIFV
jgi:hypothetical protein